MLFHEESTLTWTHAFDSTLSRMKWPLEPEVVTDHIRYLSTCPHAELAKGSNLKILLFWGPVAADSIINTLNCKGTAFSTRLRSQS